MRCRFALALGLVAVTLVGACGRAVPAAHPSQVPPAAEQAAPPAAEQAAPPAAEQAAPPAASATPSSPSAGNTSFGAAAPAGPVHSTPPGPYTVISRGPGPMPTCEAMSLSHTGSWTFHATHGVLIGVSQIESIPFGVMVDTTVRSAVYRGERSLPFDIKLWYNDVPHRTVNSVFSEPIRHLYGFPLRVTSPVRLLLTASIYHPNRCWSAHLPAYDGPFAGRVNDFAELRVVWHIPPSIFSTYAGNEPSDVLQFQASLLSPYSFVIGSYHGQQKSMYGAPSPVSVRS